jgi:hypothetical protein
VGRRLFDCGAEFFAKDGFDAVHVVFHEREFFFHVFVRLLSLQAPVCAKDRLANRFGVLILFCFGRMIFLFTPLSFFSRVPVHNLTKK